MGIRSTLKKELMNLDALDLMTADDVRRYLKANFSRVTAKGMQGLSLISRFNELHSKVNIGLPINEPNLQYERHRLFKDVLYPKAAIKQWAMKHAF